MKRTFVAVLSNGKVIRRTSEHNYRTAVTLRNRATGECRGIKFSELPDPSPDWHWVGATSTRSRYGCSSSDRDKWRRAAEAERTKWAVEVVQVTILEDKHAK